jgi:hypothetical protein
MSKNVKKQELSQKKANEGGNPSFTGLNMESFTKEDLIALNDLFSVLASDKRLDMVKTIIFDTTTRLKDIAKKLGEKNSAQVALHAKKLYNVGLLKKEGASLRDSREYLPTIPEETYIFLRLSLLYTQILRSRKAELELEKLNDVAETANETLAISPMRITASKLSWIPAQYETSLKLAHEVFQKLVNQFKKIIDVNEI